MNFHDAVWESIDQVARMNRLTCSGLAKKSGLDATIFNRSKRQSAHGQPRWTSTETIVKILHSTNTSALQFAKILQGYLDQD